MGGKALITVQWGYKCFKVLLDKLAVSCELVSLLNGYVTQVLDHVLL